MHISTQKNFPLHFIFKSCSESHLDVKIENRVKIRAFSSFDHFPILQHGRDRKYFLAHAKAAMDKKYFTLFIPSEGTIDMKNFKTIGECNTWTSPR